jgi:endonuclease YncB( thermonuclease family)
MMAMTAWYLEDWIAEKEHIVGTGQRLHVADGDSFTIGATRLRLGGIDAPEYLQTCKDTQGNVWDCGKSSRAALQTLLAAPSLLCTVMAQDRYGRSIATCSTSQSADVAAVQVANGMAISTNFHGLGSYGAEQDTAEQNKKGIWAGAFLLPSDWRASHHSP